ncbi:IclR family transcriptional regulator [Pseudonocardia ailaonensis]
MYALSTRTFELGNQVPFARANGLRDCAMPILSELYAQTGHVVHLAVPDGPAVLVIEKLYGPESVRVGTTVGMRCPGNATALGRAILAFSEIEPGGATPAQCDRPTASTVDIAMLDTTLEQIRQRGYATDFGEAFLGISCIAVPIVDRRTGRPVAAMSLSARAEGRSILRYRARMLDAAEQVSDHVGSGEVA